MRSKHFEQLDLPSHGLVHSLLRQISVRHRAMIVASASCAASIGGDNGQTEAASRTFADSLIAHLAFCDRSRLRRVASAAAAKANANSQPGSDIAPDPVDLAGAAATAIVTLLTPTLPALSVTVNCNSKLPAAVVSIATVAAVALPEMLATVAPPVIAHW